MSSDACWLSNYKMMQCDHVTHCLNETSKKDGPVLTQFLSKYSPPDSNKLRLLAAEDINPLCLSHCYKSGGISMNMKSTQCSDISSNYSAKKDCENTDVFEVHRFSNMKDEPNSAFEVNGFDGAKGRGWEGDSRSISGDLKNGFHDVKERRDSGFHTMSRPIFNPKDGHDDTPIPESQTDLSSDLAALQISPQALPPQSPSPKGVSRDRCSPVIRYRSDHHPALTATEFAVKLFRLDGYQKSDVAQNLSKKDTYSIMVSKHYMQMFNFSDVSIVEALRTFFTHLVLLGETQERERVLGHFSERYVQCNTDFLDGTEDTTHKLVCAIALLNTDLHLHSSSGLGGRHRMTCKQFISNLAGMGPNGNDFPSDLLKECYRSIKKKTLPWSGAEEATTSSSSQQLKHSVTKSPSMKKPKSSKSSIVTRSQSMNRTGHEILSPPLSSEAGKRAMIGGRNSKIKTLPRKQAVMWRKLILDSDGNKTSKRRRNWKLLVVALHGLDLHLAKKGASQANKISIHHSLAEAEPSGGETKRTNVFRVTLANKSASLFQASSPDELEKWISAINRNAALLSAAPLAAAIGSECKFQRPLQPSSASTLPLLQQKQQQEGRLVMLRNDLQQMSSASKAETSAEQQYDLDKRDYLTQEIRKYEIYIASLSELESASRYFNGGRAKTTEITESNHAKSERPSPDSQSLLSVSPSEPGAASLSASTSTVTSSYHMTDDTLVHRSDHHFDKTTPVRVALSPTSSLPNLPYFQFPPASMQQGSIDETDGNSVGSSTSLAQTAFDSVPVVRTTSDGCAVKLVDHNQDEAGRSAVSASNQNNSNHVGRFSSTNPNAKYFSHGTTGRIRNGRSAAAQANMTLSTSVDRIPVQRHQSLTSARGDDVTAMQRKSLRQQRPAELMVTSYLHRENAGMSEGQNLRRLVAQKSIDCSAGKTLAPSSSTVSSALPRVRGRRERQGSSRYSYMQAVHVLSQTDV